MKAEMLKYKDDRLQRCCSCVINIDCRIWFVFYNYKLFVKAYKDHDNYTYANMKVNDTIFQVKKP
jgi:hypothetical protein